MALWVGVVRWCGGAVVRWCGLRWCGVAGWWGGGVGGGGGVAVGWWGVVAWWRGGVVACDLVGGCEVSAKHAPLVLDL